MSGDVMFEGVGVSDKKPPYKVPSMRSIARTKKSGLKVVSTFTGCGGSCLGFKMVGFETVWASEFVEAARDTYRVNSPAYTWTSATFAR